MDCDLAIIGGGPAGLTAAIYASRALLRTVVCEELMPGGLINLADRIDNFPGYAAGTAGADLGTAMAEQARAAGVTIESAAVARVEPLPGGGFRLQLAGKQLTAAAVICAAGTRPRRVGIDGEERLTGRGVSYCATCDGPMFRGKTVAVVGGGDTAVKEALFLTRFCSRVHLVHRRSELRAEKALQRELLASPKIAPEWNTVPVAVRGESGVTGLRLRDVTTNAERELAVDGVFVFIGYDPRTEPVAGLVEVDRDGGIVTGAGNATRTPGLFAAGDVRAGVIRQVVTAAADGAAAALAVIGYLESK